MIHDKLVRHHLPEQLRAKGEKIETRIAAPEERLVLLRDKLLEEVAELSEAIDSGNVAQVIGEMADVHAVFLALREWLGPDVVDEASREKFFDRGSFTRCIVMKLDEPVPMILLCPKCGTKHVDRGIYGTTRIHRTHLCAGCGTVWQPFTYATVGVEGFPVNVTGLGLGDLSDEDRRNIRAEEDASIERNKKRDAS